MRIENHFYRDVPPGRPFQLLCGCTLVAATPDIKCHLIRSCGTQTPVKPVTIAITDNTPVYYDAWIDELVEAFGPEVTRTRNANKVR